MSRRFCVIAALLCACGGSSSTVSPGQVDVPTRDAGGVGPDDGGTANDGSIKGGAKTPVPAMAFIVNKIFLGESDRTGSTNKDAWKSYGRNIDTLVTNVTGPTSPDLAAVCKRRAGAPATVMQDGNDGIDNAWGKEIIKLLEPFAPTPSKSTTDQIVEGARTAMISLNGNGGSLVYAEDVSAPPTFAPDEKRAVAADSTTAGNPNAVIFGGGVGTDGFYDSGILVGVTSFQLSLSGQDLVIPLRAASIRMKISADGLTATEGTLSGVAPTEELIAAMDKVMGSFSTELCSGTTKQGVEDSIRQASDIMQDATQDPTKECDGISVGIGFDATRVVIGDIAAPKPPPTDPCN